MAMQRCMIFALFTLFSFALAEKHPLRDSPQDAKNQQCDTKECATKTDPTSLLMTKQSVSELSGRHVKKHTQLEDNDGRMLDKDGTGADTKPKDPCSVITGYAINTSSRYCAVGSNCCSMWESATCGETCAKIRCERASGEWKTLNYSSNPYTCQLQAIVGGFVQVATPSCENFYYMSTNGEWFASSGECQYIDGQCKAKTWSDESDERNVCKVATQICENFHYMSTNGEWFASSGECQYIDGQCKTKTWSDESDERNVCKADHAKKNVASMQRATPWREDVGRNCPKKNITDHWGPISPDLSLWNANGFQALSADRQYQLLDFSVLHPNSVIEFMGAIITPDTIAAGQIFTFSKDSYTETICAPPPPFPPSPLVVTYEVVAYLSDTARIVVVPDVPQLGCFKAEIEASDNLTETGGSYTLTWLPEDEERYGGQARAWWGNITCDDSRCCEVPDESS